LASLAARAWPPGHAEDGEGVVMKARVGDCLVPDGDHYRVGVIIGLRHADGSPPYVVKWLSDGHIALVFPGPYTRLVRRRPKAPSNGMALKDASEVE
jgi:hypothetical protein